MVKQYLVGCESFSQQIENLRCLSLLSESLVYLRDLILHELPRNELLVGTAKFDKLIMGTLFNDIACVHDNDLVSVPDS